MKDLAYSLVLAAVFIGVAIIVICLVARVAIAVVAP
jgi:hypothetical protein